MPRKITGYIRVMTDLGAGALVEDLC
jgi:hypothetical protein